MGQANSRGVVVSSAALNMEPREFPSAVDFRSVLARPLGAQSLLHFQAQPRPVSSLSEFLARQSLVASINRLSLQGEWQLLNNAQRKSLSRSPYGLQSFHQVPATFAHAGLQNSLQPNLAQLLHPHCISSVNCSEGNTAQETKSEVLASETLFSNREKCSAPSNRVSRKVSENTFPKKLYHILMNAEEDKCAHIISFDASGKRFCIHDEKALEAEVLSKHFRHQKFSSFQRQLYIYGFQKVPDLAAMCMYVHPSFQRGKIELVDKIEREKQSEKHSFTSMSPREAQLSIASGFVEHKSPFFPQKLYRLLLDLEMRGQIGIARFEHNGFSIQNRGLFLEALKKDFKHTRMQSFRRQLNLYGFTRDDSGVYRNRLFVKGRPEMLRDLRRRKDS